MDQNVIANLEFAKATDEIWKNISKKLDDLENQSTDVPQRIVGRSYRDFKFNSTPGQCEKPKITNQNLLNMFSGKSQNLLDTDKEKNQNPLDMDIAKNQNLLVKGNQMVKNQNLLDVGKNQIVSCMEKNQTLMFGIETEKNHNLLNMGKLRDLDMEKEQILLDMDHMLNK